MQPFKYMLMRMYCMHKRFLKKRRGKFFFRQHVINGGTVNGDSDWTCIDIMQCYSLWAKASMGLDAWRHLFKQDELWIPPCFPPVPPSNALLQEEGIKREGKIFSSLALITYTTYQDMVYLILVQTRIQLSCKSGWWNEGHFNGWITVSALAKSSFVENLVYC